ncbi:MAG TPA: class I SAM-dependent methyltransferase [Anaerolineae bacterium]
MSKTAALSGSPTTGSTHLPPRRRWDERYITLPAEARMEPTPFVTACLPKLPQQGHALDIAAGAGRHSLTLARHGLQVDAIDISWHGLRLARQRALAAHPSPGRQIRFIVADVERPWLPHAGYEVILVSFFLHRPLFPLIKARLKPGGWLVYETFIAGPETSSDGHAMRRDFLLEPDELKDTFADFEIRFYAESQDRAKATAQLLAQKPG